MRFSARPLWPFRTACVCFLTSLPHLFVGRTTNGAYDQLFGLGLLFAAIFAAFVSGPTLGATLRNGFLAFRGTVLAGLVATAVLAVVGTSPTAVYVSLVIGSLLLVTPVLQPVSTRMPWAIYTAGLALALQEGHAYQLTTALRLAFVSTEGIVVAILCTLPPWPNSRATQACETALNASGRDVVSAAETLVGILLPAGKFRHGALRSHASRLLSASTAHADAGAAQLIDAAWELGATRELTHHVELLRRCITYVHGIAMAVDFQREEDSRLAELLTHVNRGMDADGFVRGAATAPEAADAAARDVGVRVRALTDEQVAVLQSYAEHATRMDSMLAGAVGDAVAAMQPVLEDILASSTASRRKRRDLDAAAVAAAAQRREVLRCALAALEDAVTDTRKALFYSPVVGAQRVEAQARIEVSLSVQGPRMGRYLLLFCVRALGTTLLHAAPEQRQTPPRREASSPVRVSTRLKRWLASYGLPPDTGRLIYAAKLTAAVTAALAAGAAMSDTGVWSALAVAFIAPRDHADKHAGGSFRTAALRLSGTIVGSIWGYASYAIVGAATLDAFRRDAVALVLLSVGVFIFGFARYSPRHAYGAIVAQFTPYVMGDRPPAEAPQQWAIRRIQLNIVGVLIFVFVELLIAPRMAPAALRNELAAGLGAARGAVGTVWEVHVSAGGGAVCASCMAASAAQVATQVAALSAGVHRCRALLVEMSDEPDWAPLSLSSAKVPPLVPCTRLVDEFADLAVLLSLMHAVLATAEHREHAAEGRPQNGGPHIEDGAALGRLVTPCAPALRALLSRVWEHFSALEAELVPGGKGQQGALPHGASVARMEAALSAFEARTSAVFVSMLRAHRAEHAPVVPSPIMVPFLALCLCTRFLVHNSQHMALWSAEMMESPQAAPPSLADCGSDDAAIAMPLTEDDVSHDVTLLRYSNGNTPANCCPVCHRVAPSGDPSDVINDDVEAQGSFSGHDM